MNPIRFLPLAVFAAASVHAAIEPKIAPLTPADADARVGDYTSAQSPLIAEVIIDEHGDFRATVLKGFDSDVPLATLHGQNSPDATLKGDGWSASLKGGHFVATTKDGSGLDLSHSERSSPTMGAKAPAGAVILYDGTNQDAWAQKKGKDWLVEDGPSQWKILADGTLEIVAGTDCIITHQKFGDLHFHGEFRTLGWKSNSGVFFEDRYETNINETYGRFDEAPNAGFDNCTPKADRLHLRPCLPPLVWQTYDIDFKAPRFGPDGKKIADAQATVVFNGVKIYDHKSLTPPTGAAGRLGEAPTGPLMLQEHGMPVQFRNIWVVETHS